MSRTAPTNFEPHLVPVDAEGNRCERRMAVLWVVVMRTGPGQFDWLSDAKPKRLAAQEMRRIRAKMARLWWEDRSRKGQADG